MRRRAQCRLREGGEKRPDSAPAQPLSRHVSGRVLCHVRPRWRRSYGERVREGEAGRVQVKQLGEDGPEGEELRPLLSPNTRFGPTALPRGQVTAGPGAPRAAWDARSARPSLARAAPAAPPPRPVRPVASRPLGCCRPGAHASRRQRGHFLTPGHCPGCRSRPVTGPAPTPAPGCRM